MNYGQAIKVSNVRKEQDCSDDMMFQPQSKSCQEWMKEESWDLAIEALNSNATLPITEFKA